MPKSLVTSVSAIDRRVGARLRAARKRARISQAKLGLALGVTFQQIQKYEKGTNRIAVSALHQIASFLQVPTALFLDPPASSEAELPTNLTAAEHLELVQAFALVSDPDVRMHLLRLVKALAATSA